VTIVAPKPNPLEQVESDNDGVSEAEVQARHADVQRDWRNGNAAKHFEPELDALFSSPSRSDGGGFSTAEQARIEREETYLLQELAKHVSVHLRAQHMECFKAQRDGMGGGYVVGVRERGTGRVWEFAVTYDMALAAAGQDERAGFEKLVSMVTEMAIGERAKFFSRVAGLTAEIRGGN